MAGFTEITKTTDPVEILRILQEEAYKAELPKSEQQGLLTKPTISKDDESYGIVKFISDWWTDSEEKVKEARKEVLEGLVNMPTPRLPQPPMPDELMVTPAPDTKPDIQTEMDKPYASTSLISETRSNERAVEASKGLMSPPADKESIDEIVSTVVTEPSIDEGQSTDGKVTGLEIVNASRAEYKPTAEMPNISLDFNSFKGAKGTEVIVPDNASPEVREAAEKFNQMVVDFAAKHGYENYKNRGVKTTSQNKRGVSNTIHVEPFFTQDAKIETIINDNMDEFAQIYKTAFDGVTGRMVIPHGVENSKGIQDRGAVSKTFGDEYSFGEMIISSLLGS